MTDRVVLKKDSAPTIKVDYDFIIGYLFAALD